MARRLSLLLEMLLVLLPIISSSFLGMDHETQTPVIAWGAGIQDPKSGLSSWPKFSSKRSKDINQTDVAPLMASLLGTNLPQHSVGKLPLDYLDVHDSDKIEAKLANALQIHEQYLAMKVKRTKNWMPSLISRPDPFNLNIDQLLDQIESFKVKAKYGPALKLADEFHAQSLQALFHYQRYHRLPLYIVTSLSYIGFIIYVILSVLKEYTSLFLVQKSQLSPKLLLVFGIIYSLASTIGQNVPLHFFCYYFSPFYVWNNVLQIVFSLQMAPNQSKQFKELSIVFILALIVIEALVLAFFDRRALTIALVTLMLVQLPHKPRRLHKILWICLNLSLMAFTFQPSVGKERLPYLVLLSSGIASIISAFIIYKKKFLTKNLMVLSCYLLLSGLCVMFSTNMNYLSVITKISWFLMISALPLAICDGNALLKRLLSLNLALLSMYNLFSLTYEALFLTCLTLTLLFWLLIEHEKQFLIVNLDQAKVRKNPRQRNVIHSDDFIRALTFLSFTIVSFFGTGNIASLNSFDPKSIQTLVTTFSPFLMGGLLLFKVILPFLVVAIFAFSVQYVTQMPKKALFMMVLAFSDVMGLQFFFMVTDQGSWLDIGSSLSHFVIVEATVIFLQLLFQIASFAMSLNFGQELHDPDFRIKPE